MDAEHRVQRLIEHINSLWLLDGKGNIDRSDDVIAVALLDGLCEESDAIHAAFIENGYGMTATRLNSAGPVVCYEFESPYGNIKHVIDPDAIQKAKDDFLALMRSVDTKLAPGHIHVQKAHKAAMENKRIVAYWHLTIARIRIVPLLFPLFIKDTVSNYAKNPFRRRKT